jgi:hypothetical protein
MLKKLIRNCWRTSTKWHQTPLMQLQSIWTFDRTKQFVAEQLIAFVTLPLINLIFLFLYHLVHNFRRPIRQL